MSRRLVVTADDLGRDAATTATVLDLIDGGGVSSTTLLAVAPEALAAGRAAAARGVAPRLHAAVTSERELAPWLPASDDGAHLWPAGLPVDPAALSDLPDDVLLAELDAQRGDMQAAGIEPAALDPHGEALYGLSGRSRLAVLLPWCAWNGLALRLPRDPAPFLGGPPPAPLAAALEQAVGLADDLGVPIPASVLTNRRTAVELGGYERLRETMMAGLDTLPAGTSELFLHPADGLPGGAGVVRAWEARLLRDEAWWSAVETAGIEIVPDWWRGDRVDRPPGPGRGARLTP